MYFSTWCSYFVDHRSVLERRGTRGEEGRRRLQSILVLQLQSLWVLMGKGIARQPLLLLQVSQGFCHRLHWKSAPNPVPLLPVLCIAETELGAGRRGRS